MITCVVHVLGDLALCLLEFHIAWKYGQYSSYKGLDNLFYELPFGIELDPLNNNMASKPILWLLLGHLQMSSPTNFMLQMSNSERKELY